MTAKAFADGQHRWFHWVAIAVAAGALAWLLIPLSTARAAKLHWSTPHSVDTSLGQTMVLDTCTDATDCIATDESGRIVSFNPTGGAVIHRPADETFGRPAAIACPSATQCSALSDVGFSYTFNPKVMNRTQVIGLGGTRGTLMKLTDVACPSGTLCVATTATGQTIVFDPVSGGPTTSQISSSPVTQVVCPTTDQCTAINATTALTFSPTAPSATTNATIASSSKDRALFLACPTVTRCTALEADGGVVSFNPQTPPQTPPASTQVLGHTVQPLGIGCTTQTKCAVLGGNGTEVSLNPQTAAVSSAVKLEPGGLGGDALQGEGLQALTCALGGSCVAVDATGRELSFRPGASAPPAPHLIDGGTPLGGVSCPTPIQCTVAGVWDEVTFNPLSSATPKPRPVLTGRNQFFEQDGMDCPAVTLCIGVSTGARLQFDPKRFREPTREQVAAYDDAALVGFTCLSTSECVAADTDGYGISYDPKSQKFIQRRIKVEPGESLTGVACSSRQQCTAIDNDDTQLTFNPLTGKVGVKATVDNTGLDAPSGGSKNELNAISCPSVTRCVAVDTHGAAVVFNPRATTRAKPIPVDQGLSLNAIDCPNVHECVAVDSGGQAFSGGINPHTWKPTPLALSQLMAVDCPTARECVATDQSGDVYVGRSLS